ncbi:S9 family peptidase [Bacillus sp. V5-8f]|nr:S9 family peptidase [Bacillus sp. V5-8f]
MKAEAGGTYYKDLPVSISKEINKMTELGYLNGYKDKSFKPYRPITRAEVAASLVKALKLPKPKSLTGFKDVTSKNPNASAIYALKEQGLFSGENGRFYSGKSFTREQAASILARGFKLKDNGIQAVYQDEAVISKTFLADTKAMKQHFIVTESNFKPNGFVTRAQWAVWLYRALEIDFKKDGQIPLDHFFKQPEKDQFSVSPNGEYIAFVQPWENRLNIFVQKSGEKEAKRITSEKDRDIMYFTWKNNDKIVYVKDNGGDENFHIFIANRDGSGAKDMTPFPNTLAWPLDELESQPDEILIQMNQRNPAFFDVYKLNIRTGELKMAAENPGNITGWLTDHKGDVRVAVVSNGVNNQILYRETIEKPFQPVMSTKFGDSFTPVMFTYDNKKLYVISNVGRDKAALELFDPTMKKVTETIYENDQVDVLSFIPDEEKGIAAVLYETDKVQFHYMDQEYEELHKKLMNKLPGKQVSFGKVNKESTKLMVRTWNDKSLGTYYFYDPKEDRLEKIADVTPWLNESKLADVEAISYKSRDGLTLHGYLTLPKGVPAKNLPVIINPHGGPWARDSWGFNPELQFLANLGYAVLQVNFRGSTGYGKAFMDAGNKQWGKAMQNDLTDGVQWLIKEGIADQKKVAIYGGSYGGYATLAGLAFTPDLYAAGIDYVGPSNLFTLLNSLPPYWESERRMFHERMGDPVKDKDLLEEISPLFHVDKIKAPLFVVQGANDPRVKKAESDQIVSALRERGVDVPYMVKDNEGHGFYNVENQLDFYKGMEKFLHYSLKR